MISIGKSLILIEVTTFFFIDFYWSISEIDIYRWLISITIDRLISIIGLSINYVWTTYTALWTYIFFYIQPASAVHNYNTRYATNQNLCRPFSRTNYGLARFSVVASQTWEATPTKIKCLPLNSFKKEYKLFLLDSQASWTTLVCYLVLFI